MNILSTSKKIIPRFIRDFLRSKYSFLKYDLEQWRNKDNVSSLPPIKPEESKYPVKFGIIEEFAHYHRYYVSACRELGVAYELINISKNNWHEDVLNCGCDIFLVWPSVNLTIWKMMFDERLKIMVDEYGLKIFPSYKEIWLYENKRRVREWLMAKKIPHPETWIFYNEDEAMDFLKSIDYPIVRKTALGAGSSGVKILKNYREAKKDVKYIMRKGIVPYRFDSRDRQWGYVILQRYIPHDFEWRVVRIGDYFLVRKKIKKGNFASGSGIVIWDYPSDGLLDFAKYVTDAGDFKSMAVDIFETSKGFLVNELQTVFGDIEPQNRLKGQGMGRYWYDEDTQSWKFQKGYFYTNACANLRVEYILSKVVPHGSPLI